MNPRTPVKFAMAMFIGAVAFYIMSIANNNAQGGNLVSPMWLVVVYVLLSIFIGFNFFRDRMRDSITKELIKRSWKLHFPYFSYEEYSEKIEEIFEKSIKEEISKRDLEKYIKDNLSK